MKPIRFLSALYISFFTLFLYSCEGPFVSSDDLIQEKEPSGKIKQVKEVLSTSDFKILAKDISWGNNFYFVGNTATETFLFYTCEFDCNEVISKQEQNVTNKSFAFLVKNSTRFATKNRLILYKVANNTPIELLDTVEDVYKGFRYEGTDFIYTLENGTEKKISLN